jgi:hypothetical protein
MTSPDSTENSGLPIWTLADGRSDTVVHKPDSGEEYRPQCHYLLEDLRVQSLPIFDSNFPLEIRSIFNILQEKAIANGTVEVYRASTVGDEWIKDDVTTNGRDYLIKMYMGEDGEAFSVEIFRRLKPLELIGISLIRDLSVVRHPFILVATYEKMPLRIRLYPESNTEVSLRQIGTEEPIEHIVSLRIRRRQLIVTYRTIEDVLRVTYVNNFPPDINPNKQRNVRVQLECL